MKYSELIQTWINAFGRSGKEYYVTTRYPSCDDVKYQFPQYPSPEQSLIRVSKAIGLAKEWKSLMPLREFIVWERELNLKEYPNEWEVLEII